MRTLTGITTATPHAVALQPLPQPHNQQQQHSPWHSPVPYLFGGLAAMLGLIAFALLFLACSYWKLSGYLEGEERSQDDTGDLENAKPMEGGSAKAVPVFEEKIVVIMAGDERPTFIATPMTGRAFSSGDENKNRVATIDEGDRDKEGEREGCGSKDCDPES